MLTGIDPLLHADLLHALRSMGHTDTIVISDGNFPATNIAQRLLRVDGADAPRVLRAILSVMPVDAGPTPVIAMRTESENGYDAVTSAFEDVAGQKLGLLPASEFYEAARRAFAVVQTGESRFYGNVLVRKGVVPPSS